MRQVKFYVKQYNPKDKRWEKVEAGQGSFHQFGVNFEEFETGPGNYTTAIIELEDGTIESIDAIMVQFID